MRAKGYFAPERFAGRVENTTAHELALNPDVFTGRSDELILSTLVHEMAHVWQQTHGTLPRRCYHDKEWAAKMKEISLQPSTTGEPGGKETRSERHALPDFGRCLCPRLCEAGRYWLQLNWQSVPFDRGERQKKVARKTKYTCPTLWR
ncbi:MAG: SprT-like domain-containing protein [Acidobacteriota bacterium]|nr:SprT-like domain-containing protein [Acidobacteriota bacterium]